MGEDAGVMQMGGGAASSSVTKCDRFWCHQRGGETGSGERCRHFMLTLGGGLWSRVVEGGQRGKDKQHENIGDGAEGFFMYLFLQLLQ